MAFTQPFSIKRHKGKVDATSAEAAKYFDSDVTVKDARTGQVIRKEDRDGRKIDGNREKQALSY